jgi:hypothetical protein
MPRQKRPVNASRRVFFSVDRIEADNAIVEDDEGKRITVGVEALSPRPREGMVYSVLVDGAGKPVWASARVDDAEAARRKTELKQKMDALRKNDDGRDVKL